jgi:hypothetical protein
MLPDDLWGVADRLLSGAGASAPGSLVARLRLGAQLAHTANSSVHEALLDGRTPVVVKVRAATVPLGGAPGSAWPRLGACAPWGK